MRPAKIDNSEESNIGLRNMWFWEIMLDQVLKKQNRSNVFLCYSAACPRITHNDVIVSLRLRCISLSVKLDKLEVTPASQRETFFRKHIKLFPQCDEHLFFSVPGVRNH